MADASLVQKDDAVRAHSHVVAAVSEGHGCLVVVGLQDRRQERRVDGVVQRRERSGFDAGAVGHCLDDGDERRLRVAGLGLRPAVDGGDFDLPRGVRVVVGDLLLPPPRGRTETLRDGVHCDRTVRTGRLIRIHSGGAVFST